MATYRFWRLRNIKTHNSSNVELFELKLLASDGTSFSAAPTCSQVPTEGDLAYLSDSDSSTKAKYTSAGLEFVWDMGSPVEPHGVKVGVVTKNSAPRTMSLEGSNSADGPWESASDACALDISPVVSLPASLIAPVDYFWWYTGLVVNGEIIRNSFPADGSSYASLNKDVLTVGAAPAKILTGDQHRNSLRFSGTTWVLRGDTTVLHLTGDFCIEIDFIPYDTSATGALLLCKGGGSNIAWASYEVVHYNGDVFFAASSANTSYDIGGETSAPGRIGTAMVNQMNRVVILRSGNSYKGYLNNVLGYQETSSKAPFTDTSRGLSVGSNFRDSWITGPQNATFNGVIDQVRITNGHSRYGSKPPNSYRFDFPAASLSSVLTEVSNTRVLGYNLDSQNSVKVMFAEGGLWKWETQTTGSGTISGIVTIENIPGSRKVRLYRKHDGMLLRETWSAPNGAYSFSNLDPAWEYFVVAHDHLRVHNGVIQDMIQP